MTIPSQLQRRAERALHKAAIAIQKQDFEAKKKHLAEAEVCLELLRAAGCTEELGEIEEDGGFYRCDLTEDLFA